LSTAQIQKELSKLDAILGPETLPNNSSSSTSSGSGTTSSSNLTPLSHRNSNLSAIEQLIQTQEIFMRRPVLIEGRTDFELFKRYTPQTSNSSCNNSNNSNTQSTKPNSSETNNLIASKQTETKANIANTTSVPSKDSKRTVAQSIPVYLSSNRITGSDYSIGMPILQSNNDYSNDYNVNYIPQSTIQHSNTAQVDNTLNALPFIGHSSPSYIGSEFESYLRMNSAIEGSSLKQYRTVTTSTSTSTSTTMNAPIAAIKPIQGVNDGRNTKKNSGSSSSSMKYVSSDVISNTNSNSSSALDANASIVERQAYLMKMKSLREKLVK